MGEFSIIISNTSSLFTHFLFLLVFLLYIYIFCICSTVLGHSLPFFVVVVLFSVFIIHSLCFSIWRFLLRYSLTQRFFPQLSGLLISTTKALFISIPFIFLSFYLFFLLLAFKNNSTSNWQGFCWVLF